MPLPGCSAREKPKTITLKSSIYMMQIDATPIEKERFDRFLIARASETEAPCFAAKPAQLSEKIATICIRTRSRSFSSRFQPACRFGFSEL